MADERTITVELSTPVEYNGKTYKSLTFREMRVKDTFAASDEPNQTKASVLLFASLAGVDAAVIGDLTMTDMELVTDKVAPLLGKRVAEVRNRGSA